MESCMAYRSARKLSGIASFPEQNFKAKVED
jgi:hypothetical protein